MQHNPTRDLVVGLFVLVGLGTLAYLSLKVGGLEFGGKERIVLRATFDDVGGLSVRAPVKVAGVKIGQVSAIDLDDDLRAEVALIVESDLELSIDSAAAIRTFATDLRQLAQKVRVGRIPTMVCLFRDRFTTHGTGSDLWDRGRGCIRWVGYVGHGRDSRPLDIKNKLIRLEQLRHITRCYWLG